MRILRLSCAILACALPIAARAQTARYVVRGTVLDQETQAPIEGAVISTTPSIGSAPIRTDAQGRFEVSDNQEIRRLIVRRIGYGERVVDITDPGASLIIRLAPSNITMSEVQVMGYADQKKLLESGAAVSLVTESDFRRSNTVFLQNTLNLVPGVQMSVRSASSQSNILIRGIGTYSRFSVRGVKLYLNGIPLTDADGTTTLEDVDFASLGRAEVLRGPASSIYGSNLAGVVQLGTRKAPYGEISLNESVTAGSFGLLRSTTSFMAGGDDVNAYVSYGHQQIDGFREHSESKKDFATVGSDFFLNDRQSISVLATYSSIDDNFAGEVDSNALKNTPELAFPAYIAKDIGLTQEVTRLAVSHSYDFTSDFSNVTSVFTTGTSKISPVEPRFSRSSQTKYGARTLFSYNPLLGSIPARFNLGAEYNANYSLSKGYAISATGEPGAINGDNEIYAYQTNVFLQADAELVENTTLTVGASYNAVTYDNNDFLKTNLTGRREFDPVITPRVALVHVFGDEVSVYAQASTGFLPPIASQITLSGVDLPNYINLDLKPERNTSYEIGSRGALLSGQLSYDLTLYRMMVSDALVQQTTSGVTAYVNAGKSSFTGAELSLSYLALSDGTVAGISLLRPWVTYAYNQAKFDEYTLGGKDYSGNEVTGVTPNLINAGIDFAMDFGAYLNLVYQYVDKTPLKDDNSVYNEAHSLLNAKVGYGSRFGSHLRGEIFAGADNLTDAKYAATVALNAADGRFYAPAVGRNFYGGVTIGYIF